MKLNWDWQPQSLDHKLISITKPFFEYLSTPILFSWPISKHHVYRRLLRQLCASCRSLNLLLFSLSCVSIPNHGISISTYFLSLIVISFCFCCLTDEVPLPDDFSQKWLAEIFILTSQDVQALMIALGWSLFLDVLLFVFLLEVPASIYWFIHLCFRHMISEEMEVYAFIQAHKWTFYYCLSHSSFWEGYFICLSSCDHIDIDYFA